MHVHIDDSEFIDLIHSCTADEIAAVESSVEDLESELSDKADEDYVDDLATDLRAEWQQEIESAINNMPSPSVDSLEDEVNEIQRERITSDRRIRTLETQVAELELALADHRRIVGFVMERVDQLDDTFIRRTYRRALALSSKINWYSPRI